MKKSKDELPLDQSSVAVAHLRERVARCVEEGDLQRALELQKRCIIQEPLKSTLFMELSELYDSLKLNGETVVCLERALQLKELELGYRRSEGAERLDDLQSAQRVDKALEVSGHRFVRFNCFDEIWGKRYTSRSIESDICVSFSWVREEKRAPILKELAMRKQLGDLGCLSIIPVLEFGEFNLVEFDGCELQPFWEDFVGENHTLIYWIEPHTPHDRGYYLGDIVLGLLELRGYGIALLELGTHNIHFDQKAGHVRFMRLFATQNVSDADRALKPMAYLNKLNELSKAEGAKGLWADYSNLNIENEIVPLFREGRFCLQQAHGFCDQKTTGHETKSYHQLQMRDYWCEGARPLSENRLKFLRMQFGNKGPWKVGDYGCGAGQITYELAELGHEVVAIDIDRQLMNGCQLVANSIGYPVKFMTMDIDFVDNLPEVDVSVIFSLLENTFNPQENAAKIARCTRQRILLEGRPNTEGYKWVFNRFEKQVGFAGKDLEEWENAVVNWFPGFRLKCNHGCIDRECFILEFEREG